MTRPATTQHESTDARPQPRVWHIGHGGAVTLDRPQIMGILNVTPDSFSDGGLYETTSAAIDRALAMEEAGASIIDVGGESTRPGAERVDVDEQLRRVTPVIEGIRRASDIIISVDTTQKAVAQRAVDAGAAIVNDVAACTEDAELASYVARTGSGLVLMHRLRPPDADSYSDRYTESPQYDDVVADVREWLAGRVRAVTEAGVEHRRIVLDPGLGFGKTVTQNLELIARIRAIGTLDTGEFPVLSACSRKSFIGKVSGVTEAADRVNGTLAVSIAHALAGVRLFRVHDVKAHVEAMRIVRAIEGALPE